MSYIDDIAAEIKASVPPIDLPDADTAVLFRIYAVLLLAKGEQVTTTDVHNAWSAWMAGRDADHEALRPLSELPRSVEAEDHPYVQAIRDVAHKRDDDGRRR